MYKSCVQIVENHSEKPVRFFPHHPPHSPAIAQFAKVSPTLPATIPIIHTSKSQVLHSRMDQNNRGRI